MIFKVNNVSIRGGKTHESVSGSPYTENRYNWSTPGTNGSPPGFWGQAYDASSGAGSAEGASSSTGSTADGFPGVTAYYSILSSSNYISVPENATVEILATTYGKDTNFLLVLDQNNAWRTVVGDTADAILTFADPNPDLKYFQPGDVVQGANVTSAHDYL